MWWYNYRHVRTWHRIVPSIRGGPSDDPPWLNPWCFKPLLLPMLNPSMISLLDHHVYPQQASKTCTYLNMYHIYIYIYLNLYIYIYINAYIYIYSMYFPNKIFIVHYFFTSALVCFPNKQNTPHRWTVESRRHIDGDFELFQPRQQLGGRGVVTWKRKRKAARFSMILP